MVLSADASFERIEFKRTRTSKRRSSSWIFPPLAPKKRRYCICNTSDDGSLYWQCDGCKNWYHPSCLGLQEEPAEFYCKSCEEKGKVSVGRDYGTDYDELSNTTKKLKKISETCLKEKEEALSEYLHQTISCDEDCCLNIGHARHHAFCRDWLGELKKLRGKYGFGKDILEDEEFEMDLQLWLKDQYLKIVNDSSDIFSFWYTLARLEGRKSRLAGLFCKESSNCAVCYAEYVLYKEAIVFLLMELNNLSYKHANSICLHSEISKERKN